MEFEDYKIIPFRLGVTYILCYKNYIKQVVSCIIKFTSSTSSKRYKKYTKQVVSCVTKITLRKLYPALQNLY